MQELQLEGVGPIPHFCASREDLCIFAQHPSYCEPGLADVRAGLELDSDAALLIKPDADGASVGVMRIDGAAELRLYADAIACRWPEIPESDLPGAQHMLCARCSLSSHAIAVCLMSEKGTQCVGFRRKCSA